MRGSSVAPVEKSGLLEGSMPTETSRVDPTNWKSAAVYGGKMPETRWVRMICVSVNALPQEEAETLVEVVVELERGAVGDCDQALRIVVDLVLVGDGGDRRRVVLEAALDILDLIARFNRERSTTDKAAIRTSIGFASGPTLVGKAGTKRRSAYVCVGATTRRAVRLQALAALGAGPLVLDDATGSALAGRVATRALRPLVLPGSAAALPIHVLEAR